MIRAAALAIVLALSTSNDHALALLKQWIAAVDQHTAGEHDAALARISAWSYDDLDLMQGYINALAEVPANTPNRVKRRSVVGDDFSAIREMTKDLQRRGDFDRFRKRAALFHTDVAMFGSFGLKVTEPVIIDGSRQFGKQSRRVDVVSHDGQVQQYQLANPHWEFARDLLESLPKTPRVDPMVARWYRAIGAHFMLHRAFAEAVDHFDAAREVVANEPEVLYGEACLQELFGAPRIQDYVRVVTHQGVFIRGVSSPQSHFRKAVEMLRKALAAKPDFVDARLRLGRLLVEQKNYDEATTHLRQVVESTKEPVLLYYAQLFIGDAAIATNRAPDARAAYEEALSLYPNTQAARLGLAAALRLMGERQTAVHAVMSTLQLPADARTEEDEPWWAYYEGDEAAVERLLAELREPYREPRQ